MLKRFMSGKFQGGFNWMINNMSVKEYITPSIREASDHSILMLTQMTYYYHYYYITLQPHWKASSTERHCSGSNIILFDNNRKLNETPRAMNSNLTEFSKERDFCITDHQASHCPLTFRNNWIYGKNFQKYMVKF